VVSPTSPLRNSCPFHFLEHRATTPTTLYPQSFRNRPCLPRLKLSERLRASEEEGEEEKEIDWDSDDAVEQFKAGSVKRNQSIDADVIISGIETDELLLDTGDRDMLVVYE
jgi:hypothetical protein